MADADQYRLPDTAVPSHYQLVLEPDLDAATFLGTEAVTIEVRQPVTEVVLNALDLDINEAWLEALDGTRHQASVSYDTGAERATLALVDGDGATVTVGPGDYTLHAHFTGVLNDKLVGFYRSTFTDDTGAEQVIATTQFEATHARQAFPCWDEPAFKATFAVTLVVPEDLLAISNAAEVSAQPSGDGRKSVVFAETMVMSTYLVAFVVGPLEVSRSVDVNGTPLRVIHPPGRAHLVSFALDVGVKALAFFESYYGIDYPGDKLDLVAIPDFAFGAMENLGCVTFREVALLVDPDTADQPELERVADVINHELAHMWFGDLVTMRWWNGIWLNEAFATFMEMLATDAYRPDWDRWTNFGISRTAAFDTDSLRATRPIEFPVVSPAEAEGMFDVLTYEKGAAVLRMLEQYLGADRFRAGIRAYLRAHQYANTETTDLWDAIEEATDEPVRRIMDSWIFQAGYPVISAELANDGHTLRLCQERFGFDPDADQDDTRWAVPVLVRVESGGAARLEKLLLEGDSTSLDLGDVDPGSTVLVNAGGSGFYRVRYRAELLGNLTARLASLSAEERYGLVDDAYASTVAGTTDVADLLGLLRAFAEETDVSVWQRIIGVLGALGRLVDGEDRARLQGLVRALLGPALRRLGAEPAPGESDRTTTLRAELFGALGTLGDDREVQARAGQLHPADGEPTGPTSLVNASIEVLAQHGNGNLFERFLARSDQATSPQDRLRYLYALADFDDPEQAARLTELALTPAIRSQDAGYVLRRAIANRHNGEAAWRFVTSHWDELMAKLPSNAVSRMLEAVRLFNQPQTADDVRTFVGAHRLPHGAKQVSQHIERMGVSVAFRARAHDRLVAALAAADR